MITEQMYTRTIQSLRERCQSENSKGDLSLSAFADKHGFDRSNLAHILNGKQEISITLFMRIDAALNGKPNPPLPEGLERWSLRTWLQAQEVAATIHNAMYSVNFSTNN